jgi:ADP-dependent NAD(P)H-hydrate dehydratase / NAD(P)H-hydrate epimerase
MKALTAAEMREVDRLTTERFGVPSLQLMEAAGRAVADQVRATLSGSSAGGKAACVLCGKGNNGGDGFVAARHLLTAGAPAVRAFLFADPAELRGDAAQNFRRWRETGGSVALVNSEQKWELAWPEVAASGAIVDALLGTGLQGPAKGLIARAIDDLNRLSCDATSAAAPSIIAVDTPSGLPSDGGVAEGPVLRANSTVTFSAPKIGQLVSKDAPCCGRLLVRQIGSPAALVEEVGRGTLRWAGPEEFAWLPLVRAADAHKGTYGHVLILAGSVGKSGAAILAGLGCLRAGAGLTTVAVPDAILPIVAAGPPELMTEPLSSTPDGTVARVNLLDGTLTRAGQGKTVLAVGPGLGTEPETQDFIRGAVREAPLPVILDADGLNAFAGKADLLPQRKSPFLAVTPHPGEMARLLGTSSAAVQSDRTRVAQEAAKKWNVHVILKGYHTVLASPDGQVWVNTTGNAALAKGGSGDVLTGILAAATAQFGARDWLRTLALGVYLHGAAAEILGPAGEDSGVLANEVAAAVPRARAALIGRIRRGE